jgi:hypothetical protein
MTARPLPEVDLAMADLGYEKADDQVYRRSSDSGEVQHYLYYSVWGKPKRNLTAHYAFRHGRAEAFAARSVLAYGGPLYRLMEFDRPHECSLKFPLGRVARWLPRDSLNLAAMSGERLRKQLVQDVSEHVLPLVASIRTGSQLQTLLLADMEPCCWFLTNAAIRAAQIAYLSAQAGVPVYDTRAGLQAFRQAIAAQLETDADPDEYINNIVRDAEIEHEGVAGVRGLTH